MEISFFITIGIISFISLYLLRFILVIKLSKKNKKEFVLLKIFTDPENEVGPLTMENVYLAISSSFKKRTFKDWLFQTPQNKISFEIGNLNQKIGLFVYCEKSMKNIVENQLYGQYPDIEIEEIEDYLKKPNKDFKNAFGAEIKLNAPYVFPIKRHNLFEDKSNLSRLDPISGIFAGIAKLNATDENAFIQIVINPISGEWRDRGQKLMKNLSTGLFAHAPSLEAKYCFLFLSIGKNKYIRRIKAFFLKILLGWYGRGVGAQTTAEESFEANVDKSKETPIIAASSKIARQGFEVSIKILYNPKEENIYLAENKIKEMISSFYQFNQAQLNSFSGKLIEKGKKGFLRSFKNRLLKNPIVLNTEELATIWHIPENTVRIPNIEIVQAKKLEAPLNIPTEESEGKFGITALGDTDFRGFKKRFGIKAVDRRRHIYIIGKTGMGKSTILENMIFSDIQAGKGVSVIDPHGDLAEAVLSFVPKSRINDVILFDPSDNAFPISFNMLECKNKDQYDIVASGLLGVFKKMYADSWGPRLEYILRNTILALVEVEGTNMLGILRMLSDPIYRSWIVKQITNPTVINFWKDEFANQQPRQIAEAIAPIQNKVGQFLSSSMIRNIFGQRKSSIDLRFAMDKKKIIIINLSKGKIGEDNSSLLGSMMITKFQIDAMSRANIPENERIDHYLYVDEFQNFATDSFATILSEARKYKLNLTMANQYIAQMSDEVKAAVFGNVGSMVTFQVGFDDAVYFESQFGEEVSTKNIVSLPKFKAYMKIMIDGMPSKTFFSSTLPPPLSQIDEEQIGKIIKVSREKYGKSRDKVENNILKWSEKLI